MNSGSFPMGGEDERAAQPEFRQGVQAWRALLERCGRKPGRKCVHNLRVATLRLQAELEFGLRGQPAEAAGLNAARRLRRQGKKLRRALGPVRQADVYLSKLARVRGWAGSEANGHAACPAECREAISELERTFAGKRAAAEKQLASEIKRRKKKLGRLSKKVVAAPGAFARAGELAGSREIVQQIKAVAGEFPALDAGNLHEFRKRIKKIRYLAEIFARSDAAAARQAATLKRMTGSIGEWHDWQALTEEAVQADCEGAMKALAEFLQAQAARSLGQSLQLCRRSMRRLLREGRNGQGPVAEAGDEAAEPVGSGLARRKPVASTSADAANAENDPLLRAS